MAFAEVLPSEGDGSGYGTTHHFPELVENKHGWVTKMVLLAKIAISPQLLAIEAHLAPLRVEQKQPQTKPGFVIGTGVLLFAAVARRFDIVTRQHVAQCVQAGKPKRL